MLDFTRHDHKPFLRLLVLHDDAEREFAYTRGAEQAIEKPAGTAGRRSASATTGPPSSDRRPAACGVRKSDRAVSAADACWSADALRTVTHP